MVWKKITTETAHDQGNHKDCDFTSCITKELHNYGDHRNCSGLWCDRKRNSHNLGFHSSCESTWCDIKKNHDDNNHINCDQNNTDWCEKKNSHNIGDHQKCSSTWCNDKRDAIKLLHDQGNHVDCSEESCEVLFQHDEKTISQLDHSKCVVDPEDDSFTNLIQYGINIGWCPVKSLHNNNFHQACHASWCDKAAQEVNDLRTKYLVD